MKYSGTWKGLMSKELTDPLCLVKRCFRAGLLSRMLFGSHINNLPSSAPPISKSESIEVSSPEDQTSLLILQKYFKYVFNIF